MSSPAHIWKTRLHYFAALIFSDDMDYPGRLPKLSCTVLPQWEVHGQGDIASRYVSAHTVSALMKMLTSIIPSFIDHFCCY